MEKSLKGTQTEKHLMMAFAGESQARNRYTMYAKIAKKEGYEQIGSIFLQTADHEAAHAKRFYRLLGGGTVEITATFPAGPGGTTIENLMESIHGESEESHELYPYFAKVAAEEGFTAIASAFKAVAKAEQTHESRFTKLLANIQADCVFERDEVVKWMCTKCGYVHEGKKALANCPACLHPKEYFEILAENY